MLGSLFEILPERRLAGTFHLLTVLSIVLPMLAGLCAFAAWKVGDRLGKLRENTEAFQAVRLQLAASEQKQQETARVLDQTRASLHREEKARPSATPAPAAPAAVPSPSIDREVSPAQRQKFLSVAAIKPKGPVSITVITSDLEAMAYAHQLRNLLVDAGYEVDDEFGSIAPGDSPVTGLRVGAFSNESAPAHALPLAGSFIDSGIVALPVVNRRVGPGEVDVTVGVNPLAITENIHPAATPPAKR